MKSISLKQVDVLFPKPNRRRRATLRRPGNPRADQLTRVDRAVQDSRPGTLVLVTVDKNGMWVGPFLQPMMAKLRTLLSQQRVASFTAQVKSEDLETLASGANDGRCRSVIDRLSAERGTVAKFRRRSQEEHSSQDPRGHLDHTPA